MSAIRKGPGHGGLNAFLPAALFFDIRDNAVAKPLRGHNAEGINPIDIDGLES